MEGLLTIALVIGAWWAFWALVGAGAKTASAAGKSLMGKGTFKENMELQFKGIPDLEARMVDGHLGDDDDGPPVKQIEVRGVLPLGRTAKQVGFLTSVLDITDGDPRPVLSAIENFQEPDSVCYQQRTEIGELEPGQGFISWVSIGGVIPQILEPPFGGRRKLAAVLRLINLTRPSAIQYGFATDDDSILWQSVLEFDYEVPGKGYEEAAEHRDEAFALAIKIAMAVAMADGSLDESEGETLRQWILRAVSPFSDEKQSELKQSFNDAMKAAYADAKSGDLSLSALTERLNEIGETSAKYDAVELCFDVMAADGVADAEEMKTIRQVADALELDFDEIDKMRDQKIVGLSTSVAQQATIEDLLGIEADWDEARVRKFLRKEFQKWNNRLNTLPEGDERSNAQRMLDLIAEARKTYG